MSNVTYLPWVPPEGEPTQEHAQQGTQGRTVKPAPVVFETVSEPQAAAGPVSIDEVYESLLRKLGMADMSASEVRTWLSEKDLDETDIEEMLAKVEHLGYVDDYRLATQLVLRLTNRKGQGRTAIAMELRKRKLTPSAIDEAIHGIDDTQELDRAISQAMNRAPSLQRLDKATAERRLQGFLLRRGYPSDITREAIRAAFSEYPPVG